MYFLPLRVLEEKGHLFSPEVILQCYQIYSQEMIKLHMGQGIDIHWHSHTAPLEKLPTTQNYLHMCAYKTGGLARMSAKISAILCGASVEQTESLAAFAEAVGVAFQIQDDILNLQTESTLSIGKGGPQILIVF